MLQRFRSSAKALLFQTATICCLLSTSGAFAQQEPQCPDTVTINSAATIYGYEYKDIDTVKVLVYLKNSGFKTPVDSFRVYTPEIKSNMHHAIFDVDLGSVKPMSNAFEYSITLKNKKVFKIADIKTGIIIERHQFKRCRMISYVVNGRRMDGNGFELAKPGYVIKKNPDTKQVPPKGAKNRMIL